jgi:hypothetical protein
MTPSMVHVTNLTPGSECNLTHRYEGSPFNDQCARGKSESDIPPLTLRDPLVEAMVSKGDASLVNGLELAALLRGKRVFFNGDSIVQQLMSAWRCDLSRLAFAGEGTHSVTRTVDEGRESDAWLTYLKGKEGSDPMFIGSQALDEATNKMGIARGRVRRGGGGGGGGGGDEGGEGGEGKGGSPAGGGGDAGSGSLAVFRLADRIIKIWIHRARSRCCRISTSSSFTSAYTIRWGGVVPFLECILIVLTQHTVDPFKTNASDINPRCVFTTYLHVSVSRGPHEETLHPGRGEDYELLLPALHEWAGQPGKAAMLLEIGAQHFSGSPTGGYEDRNPLASKCFCAPHVVDDDNDATVADDDGKKEDGAAESGGDGSSSSRNMKTPDRNHAIRELLKKYPNVKLIPFKKLTVRLDTS